MGASSSIAFATPAAHSYTSIAEALAAGKTQEEIDEYLKANPSAQKTLDASAKAEEAAAAPCVFDATKILEGGETEGRIDTANAAVMEGDSDWRPCLSVQGGSTGVHTYVLRVETNNGVAVGVAGPDVDVSKMIANEPRAWCWVLNTGWKWHDGHQVEDFAPVIADSELPVELTIIADCNAGTMSVTRDGVLVGGKVVYEDSELKGKDLRLAVGTYDDACRVTIVSYEYKSPA